jgi:hypothetical protein
MARKKPSRKKPLKDSTNLTWEQMEEKADKILAGRRLQKSRPWAYDISRVLWASRSVSMHQLTQRLWDLRNPSGLPMPKRFQRTVQSALNHHTSQSIGFNRKPEDDLFYSPEGKGSGTWAVHRERAAAWAEAHALPPI